MRRKNKKAATKAKSKVFTSWYEFNKWLVATDYNLAKPIFTDKSHTGGIPVQSIQAQ